MVLKCQDIVNIMRTMAPEGLAEDWDNCGLNVGRPESEVRRVMVALDATEGVIDEAAGKGVDMIVTHHPMLFRGIKRIDYRDGIGRRIYKLIENGIGLYCAHTSLDIAWGGINDRLAELAGLKNISILSETKSPRLASISVYAPKGHEASVKAAMQEAGAGNIGNYSGCFFSVDGAGEFCPEQGSAPYIGREGARETVSEVKLEAVAQEDNIEGIISAIKRVHPYETPAYNVVLTENKARAYGLGRIGDLERGVDFASYALGIKNALGLNSMRIVGDKKAEIKRVALCSGAGADFIGLAAAMGADCYITADIKFHEAQKAIELGICLIDATHFASENIIVPCIKAYIETEAASSGAKIEVFEAETDGQTFKNI